MYDTTATESIRDCTPLSCNEIEVVRDRRMAEQRKNRVCQSPERVKHDPATSLSLRPSGSDVMVAGCLVSLEPANPQFEHLCPVPVLDPVECGLPPVPHAHTLKGTGRRVTTGEGSFSPSGCYLRTWLDFLPQQRARDKEDAPHESIYSGDSSIRRRR